jgi:hypothetical protein
MKRLIKSSLLAMLVFAMTACNADQDASTAAKEEQKDKYTALAEKVNKESKLEMLELRPYGKEVDATLSSPKYKEFSANSSVLVKGKVKKFSGFKSDRVWIEVRSEEDGPAGTDFSYYAPIKEGKFEQKVQLFNGKGRYSVKVSLPSETAEDYYYELATFKVENVNPEVKRDILFTKNAFEQGLILDSSLDGFMEKDESFELKGEVKDTNVSQIMVELKKENDSTKIMVPVEDGKFNKKIPLYFGEGVHEVQVMTPRDASSNFYYEAAGLYVKNLSSQVSEPIQFSKEYKERGFTLKSPEAGGEKTNLAYTIKGSIDPSAPDAKKTDAVFVNTKKDDLEAMYMIPVKDNSFEGEVYLRFGPGKYEVTLMAPDFVMTNGYMQHFKGMASFTIENTNPQDQRYTLPSRGIQSDAPAIKKLAEQLTKNKKTEREKALAVYEYVAKNVKYDVEKLNYRQFEFDDSALKTLDEKTGVCQDFTYLSVALLRASGMQAQVVTGFAGQNHAWVETKVDGRWLTMDPTWGSGYLQNNKFVQKFTMQYFDPKPAEFQKTHTKREIEF